MYTKSPWTSAELLKRSAGRTASSVQRSKRPQDVGVGGGELGGVVLPLRFVFRLVGKRPLVAVGQAAHIQAEHFAAAAQDVHAVAVDRGRGADPEVLSSGEQIVIPAAVLFPLFGPLGRGEVAVRGDQLPDELARRLVQTDHAAATRSGRAHEDAAVRDGRVPVRAGDQFVLPLDVRVSRLVEARRRLAVPRSQVRQPLLAADHVPFRAAAPLRPIVAPHGGAKRQPQDTKANHHASRQRSHATAPFHSFPGFCSGNDIRRDAPGLSRELPLAATHQVADPLCSPRSSLGTENGLEVSAFVAESVNIPPGQTRKLYTDSRGICQRSH